MPRPVEDFAKAPIILERWKNDFEDVDYIISLDAPFAIAAFIQTWQEEGTAKQLFVSIRVALVDPGTFMQPEPPTPEKDGPGSVEGKSR